MEFITAEDRREINALQTEYLKAKALYEMLEEMSNEIEQEILLNGYYEVGEDVMDVEHTEGYNPRITKPSEAWKMASEDYKDFLNKRYEEYIKQGIDDCRGSDYNASAKACEMMRQAEDLLLNKAICLIPSIELRESMSSALRNIKYRDKLLRIILSLDCGKIYI